MKFLSRREWEARHGVARRYGTRDHPKYATGHTEKWASIGWSWTPVMCECPEPCYLSPEAKNE